MNLKDLEGAHVLNGVDFSNEELERYPHHMEMCQVCRFRLDGVTYAAIENPDDGYRSMMDELQIIEGHTMKNSFPGVAVFAKHKSKSDGDDCDILQIFDAETAALILEIGTDCTNDYYPIFVAEYHPEAMSINR